MILAARTTLKRHTPDDNTLESDQEQHSASPDPRERHIKRRRLHSEDIEEPEVGSLLEYCYRAINWSKNWTNTIFAAPPSSPSTNTMAVSSINPKAEPAVPRTPSQTVKVPALAGAWAKRATDRSSQAMSWRAAPASTSTVNGNPQVTETSKTDSSPKMIDLTGSPSPFNAIRSNLEKPVSTNSIRSEGSGWAPSGFPVASGFGQLPEGKEVMSLRPNTKKRRVNVLVAQLDSTKHPEPPNIGKDELQAMLADQSRETASVSSDDFPTLAAAASVQVPKRSYAANLRKAAPKSADDFAKQFAKAGISVPVEEGPTTQTLAQNGTTPRLRSGMKLESSTKSMLPALQRARSITGRVGPISPEKGLDLSVLQRHLDEIEIANEKAIRNALEAAKPVSVLPKLTDKMRQEVEKELVNPRFASKCLRENVEHKDLRLLGPRQWLNDEVINFYVALLQVRADNDLVGEPGKQKKKRDIHCFNSYFYAKLKEDYVKSKVGRWTKKIDIFAKDLIIFPVNLNNMHWICCIINMKDKRIECYDSMNPKGDKEVFKRVRKYLAAEHMEKKKKPFDFEGWVDFFDMKAPQQNNGHDCGVFSCQTLEHRARGVGDGADGGSARAWEFDQEDMADLRNMMAYEIAKAKLLPRAGV